MQNASLTLTRYAGGDFMVDPHSFGPRITAQHTRSETNLEKKISFEKLFEEWAAEKSPSGKTRYAWQRVLNQLAAFLGHNN